GDAKVQLKQTTKYPWEGRVTIAVSSEKPQKLEINLRIPNWCPAAKVTVNGEAIKSDEKKNGYVAISREWKSGDSIQLDMEMPVKRIYADPKVKADVGRVAIQRGPMIYCLEGVDNSDGSVRNLMLPKDSQLTSEFRADLLGGVTVVKGKAKA